MIRRIGAQAPTVTRKPLGTSQARLLEAIRTAGKPVTERELGRVVGFNHIGIQLDGLVRRKLVKESWENDLRVVEALS